MTQSTPLQMSTPQSSKSPQGALPVRTIQGSGLRYPTNKKTIYDRNRDRTKNAESSRAAFAYMFVEMIRYTQRKVKDMGELEARLNTMGYPIGLRLLDLLLARTTTSSSQPPSTRPLRILQLLQFITNNLWRHLFSRPADGLEQSVSNQNEYMIIDNDPLVSQYISVPRESKDFNPNAFVAGIIEGVCDACGFTTAGGRGLGVSAHWGNEEDAEKGGRVMWPDKTVFLIRFAPEVLEREEALGKGDK